MMSFPLFSRKTFSHSRALGNRDRDVWAVESCHSFRVRGRQVSSGQKTRRRAKKEKIRKKRVWICVRSIRQVKEKGRRLSLIKRFCLFQAAFFPPSWITTKFWRRDKNEKGQRWMCVYMLVVVACISDYIDTTWLNYFFLFLFSSLPKLDKNCVKFLSLACFYICKVGCWKKPKRKEIFSQSKCLLLEVSITSTVHESHTQRAQFLILDYKWKTKTKNKKTCALGLYKERFVIEASFDHVPMNYFILYTSLKWLRNAILFIWSIW